MWQFLLGLCFVLASLRNVDGAMTFDLVRTAGGHLGSHFVIGTNNTIQYRFLLFDLTATGLWTFVSTDPVDVDFFPGPFDISNENISQFSYNNVTNYDPSYKFFSVYGYYDQPMDATWIPFNINKIYNGNNTLRNQTTTILGVPTNSVGDYAFWNSKFFDGVFGIGNGVQDLVPNSNYTTGWITKNSTILLYTPTSQANYGKLIIDATAAPPQCANAGLAVNLSKTVYLRSTDFEFNITAAAGNGASSVYAYEKTWPATLSTMSSFITVDNSTWSWIEGELNPVTDPYAVPGSDIPHPFFKVKCSAMSTFRLAITMTNQLTGQPVALLIPGSALIKQNPYGDCLLRVQPNAADFWVLGIPFLESYCFQLNPAAQEVIFMNKTVSEAYPTAPAMNLGQSQSFYNAFGYRS